MRKEIAQRKRAEEALQKSEANLKQTQQMAHLGSWEWDLEDDSFLISGEMCRIYGLSESYRSHKVHAFMEATIYPDDLEMVKNSIEAFIAGKGNEKIITYRIIRLDSEIRWILSSPTKIKNVGKDGKPKVLIGTVQDITELKLTEEHIKAALKKKEVFIKKTHHRIKNNFRVISSLLDLQSWFINNMQALEVFKNSQERVRAIALIYEKLYESGDLSKIEIQEYIQNMAAYLYNSYSLQPELVRLKIEIKDVSLDIDTIVPVGLIINELVTNSFKYAFPNNKEGELRIILENSKDNKYDYILIVADNGVPEDIEFQASDNLFIRLLNTLVNQLHGVLNIDKKDGTTFTIKFKKLKHKKGDDSEKTTQNGENNNQQ